MRPIDADVVIEKVMNYCKDDDGSCVEASADIRELLDEIENLPTIQPVATDTNVGDTISRQWLMECVNEGWIKFDTVKDENRFIHLVRDIAPPVQPEPKEGHWIPHETPDGGEQYECSRCGVLWEFNDGTPEDNEAYFCPKCGTKMTTSTK